jgi:hypothetical protein
VFLQEALTQTAGADAQDVKYIVTIREDAVTSGEGRRMVAGVRGKERDRDFCRAIASRKT